MTVVEDYPVWKAGRRQERYVQDVLANEDVEWNGL